MRQIYPYYRGSERVNFQHIISALSTASQHIVSQGLDEPCLPNSRGLKCLLHIIPKKPISQENLTNQYKVSATSMCGRQAKLQALVNMIPCGFLVFLLHGPVPPLPSLIHPSSSGHMGQLATLELHCTQLQCITMHCTVLVYTALNHNELCCAGLYSNALQLTALFFVALHLTIKCNALALI